MCILCKCMCILCRCMCILCKCVCILCKCVCIFLWHVLCSHVAALLWCKMVPASGANAHMLRPHSPHESAHDPCTPLICSAHMLVHRCYLPQQPAHAAHTVLLLYPHLHCSLMHTPCTPLHTHECMRRHTSPHPPPRPLAPLRGWCGQAYPIPQQQSKVRLCASSLQWHVRRCKKLQCSHGACTLRCQQYFFYS